MERGRLGAMRLAGRTSVAPRRLCPCVAADLRLYAYFLTRAACSLFTRHCAPLRHDATRDETHDRSRDETRPDRRYGPPAHRRPHLTRRAPPRLDRGDTLVSRDFSREHNQTANRHMASRRLAQWTVLGSAQSAPRLSFICNCILTASIHFQTHYTHSIHDTHTSSRRVE